MKKKRAKGEIGLNVGLVTSIPLTYVKFWYTPLKSDAAYENRAWSKKTSFRSKLVIDLYVIIRLLDFEVVKNGFYLRAKIKNVFFFIFSSFSNTIWSRNEQNYRQVDYSLRNRKIIISKQIKKFLKLWIFKISF